MGEPGVTVVTHISTVALRSESLSLSDHSSQVGLIFRSLLSLLGRLRDRMLAKFAFHNRSRYRELVAHSLDLAGQRPSEPATLLRLRKFDPTGLGVWYLAKAGRQPKLEDVCRKAIGLPGLGPPRAVASQLDRVLLGRSVSWFGKSDGFDALMAESLLSAGLAATLVAAELAWSEGPAPLMQAANQLTRTANAMQAAGRAHERVVGSSVAAAQEATAQLFQSGNMLRRALNHTDLLALDDQIARESARVAAAAASSACSAAMELTTDFDIKDATPDQLGSRDKLAALTRTVDALASRVAVSLRSEPPPPSTQQFIVDQSGRILAEAAKSLRPWTIELPLPSGPATSSGFCDMSVRANDLTESSAAVLESWAALHEIKLIQSDGNSSAAIGRRSNGWADWLVRVLTGRWTCEEVLDSIGKVSERSDQAVMAAVGLAVLRSDSLQLRRELWRLIRSPRCANLERSLAFQLFWRLELT